MRRIVIIFSVAVLFVAALAFWEPITGFIDNIYNRPFKSLTDDQLRSEIAVAESMVTALAEQSTSLARQPTAPGNVDAAHESWAEVDKAGTRLRQLRAELAFRVDRVRYGLIGAFALAFLVFFLFFRDTYRTATPGQHDREQAGAQIAREQRQIEQAHAQTAAAERLGRIDSRLLRLQVGRSSRQHVTAILGLPAETTPDPGDQTLTYFINTKETAPGETEARSERVEVQVVLRGGVVTEIKVEKPEADQPITKTL